MANGILSFKITTYTSSGGANGVSRVDTYNIRNEATATRVTLKTLFGEKYPASINAQIRADMAKDKGNYFAEELKGVTEDSSFYVKGRYAYVVFQQNDIRAARKSGNSTNSKSALPTNSMPSDFSATSITVDGRTLQGVKLDMNDDGIVLAPVRAISEALGYELTWNTMSGSLELKKGVQWTSVSKNKDSYIYNKMAPITLGTAPIINDKGTMYVPMSFFTEILKASVQYESGIISIFAAS